MTTTSVKDVSTVRASFVSNVGNAAATNAKTNFQDVWNNHTGKNTLFGGDAPENKKVSDGADSARRSEALKIREAARADRKDVVSAEDAGTESLDEKKREEAMEVLGTAAVELMQEIADTFGMSMEELEQLMADMNMDAVDLLDAGKLSALLLEAGGASDSLALLTDEGLCSKFQVLMNRQKEMLAQISESLQMTPEQLTQLLEEMSDYQPGSFEMLAVDTTDIPDAQDVRITVEADEGQSMEQEIPTKDANALTEEALAGAEETGTDEAWQGSSGEQHFDGTGEQTGNLLLQNLKADHFNAELQQVNAEAPGWNETTQDIMRQIMDYMKIQVKADTSSLEMQLHPASLGTLQIQVASKGGVVTANFITQNEMVKAALESQMVQLQESLAQQGVKVEAIEVTVQTHQFESNLEQGRGRQQGETEKKGRTRRINLNVPMDMEDMEAMTAEEQLTADMMTANGNTVDYTA